MAQTINGSGNPHSYGDVHAASDGQLKQYSFPVHFTVPEKQRLIQSLAHVIMERGNKEIREYGVQGLAIISRDAGQPPNWQAIDKIAADDVAAEICVLLIRVNDDQIIDTCINHISEQLADMIKTNGFCPSGRVNRLYQCYMIIHDYLEGMGPSRSS